MTRFAEFGARREKRINSVLARAPVPRGSWLPGVEDPQYGWDHPLARQSDASFSNVRVADHSTGSELLDFGRDMQALANQQRQERGGGGRGGGAELSEGHFAAARSNLGRDSRSEKSEKKAKKKKKKKKKKKEVKSNGKSAKAVAAAAKAAKAAKEKSSGK